jgi:hypothetical protein
VPAKTNAAAADAQQFAREIRTPYQGTTGDAFERAAVERLAREQQVADLRRLGERWSVVQALRCFYTSWFGAELADALTCSSRWVNACLAVLRADGDLVEWLPPRCANPVGRVGDEALCRGIRPRSTQKDQGGVTPLSDLRGDQRLNPTTQDLSPPRTDLKQQADPRLTRASNPAVLKKAPIARGRQAADAEFDGRAGAAIAHEGGARPASRPLGHGARARGDTRSAPAGPRLDPLEVPLDVLAAIRERHAHDPNAVRDVLTVLREAACHARPIEARLAARTLPHRPANKPGAVFRSLFEAACNGELLADAQADAERVVAAETAARAVYAWDPAAPWPEWLPPREWAYADVAPSFDLLPGYAYPPEPDEPAGIFCDDLTVEIEANAPEPRANGPGILVETALDLEVEYDDPAELVAIGRRLGDQVPPRVHDPGRGAQFLKELGLEIPT